MLGHRLRRRPNIKPARVCGECYAISANLTSIGDSKYRRSLSDNEGLKVALCLIALCLLITTIIVFNLFY